MEFRSKKQKNRVSLDMGLTRNVAAPRQGSKPIVKLSQDGHFRVITS